MAHSQALVTQESGSVQKVFESNLLDELLFSQKEAARFLEFAYLALREDPEISGEVRSTADDSQNQHLNTYGLVREYQGTAFHVVNTMLPLVEIGIKKKKEKLVEKGLEKVLTYVDDMVRKTAETIKEYTKIKAAVNDEMTKVDKKNKDIKERERQISAEIKEKQLEIKSGMEEETKLEARYKEQQSDLKMLQSKRAKYIAKSVQSYGKLESLKDLFITGIGALVSIASVEKGKAVLDAARKVSIDRKEQASRQALKASDETKVDINQQQQKLKENEKRTAEMKLQAIQNLVAMEKLALEKENVMNEESLKLAAKELGNVVNLFAKILLFWNDFSAKLSLLKKSHDSIKVFIEFMNDPAIAEDIDESVGQIKMIWSAFGTTCTRYVEKSVRQLPDLYAFLATPADHITITECAKRKKELLESQRAEIRNLELKVFSN